MYKYFLRFALIYCFVINGIDCSYCGPYSVPYSLEVTPSGGLILGCTRSSCLGISPSQETSLQYSYFYNNDGFVRADASPGEPSPLEGVNPICEPAFSSGACPLPTQWVGGIIPGAGVANGSFALACCVYAPTQFGREIGVAVVSQGQIYSGGDVTFPGEMPSFDYIQNIQAVQNADGTTSYYTYVKRLTCLPRPAAGAVGFPVQPAIAPGGAQSGYYSGFSAPSGFGWACFSGDTTVEMSNGNYKRLDELEVGEWVTGVYNNQKVIVKVDDWIHRKTSEMAEFLNLHFENGKNLKITAQHYIYKVDCQGDLTEFEKNMVFAEQLQVGDCVITKTAQAFRKVRITSITTTKEMGYYSPKTATENILVNDVLASCYSMIKGKGVHVMYRNTKSALSNSWIGRFVQDLGVYVNTANEVDLIPGTKMLFLLLQQIIEAKF